jgi:hypothetical protein
MEKKKKVYENSNKKSKIRITKTEEIPEDIKESEATEEQINEVSENESGDDSSVEESIENEAVPTHKKELLEEGIDPNEYAKLLEILKKSKVEVPKKSKPGRPRKYDYDEVTGKPIKPKKPYIMTEARMKNIERLKEINREKARERAREKAEKSRGEYAKQLLKRGDKETMASLKQIIREFEVDNGVLRTDDVSRSRTKKKKKKQVESSSESEASDSEISEDEYKPYKHGQAKANSVKEKVKKIEQKKPEPPAVPDKPKFFFK